MAGIVRNQAHTLGKFFGQADGPVDILKTGLEGLKAPPDFAGSRLGIDKGCAEGAHQIERPVRCHDEIMVPVEEEISARQEIAARARIGGDKIHAAGDVTAELFGFQILNKRSTRNHPAPFRRRRARSRMRP
ncbi:MAG: hypothetical protein Q8K28_05700 [Hoeflea sp.]|uniref:hypothetical protein n=1 Tax=Hoeflea sp. TaxID=1940281 RepID=UPI00272FF820|nr:hypothetical protein [Hoeflea sp.]MDP2119379.1 hypothetical protein [Hoeflea sp.]